MATLLTPKPLEFKHFAGPPPVSVSREQKARQADCAQGPSWDVQVIDLTQEASEGITDMLNGGYLLISTSTINSYQRR
jgi:hypothetical protein